MLKDEGPEVRSLALLIQLFGREVLDRLREAGFVSPLAIARAGPEMLAEQGGIALPLARRIVAVAMETEGIGELPGPDALADVAAPVPEGIPGGAPAVDRRRRRADRGERARPATGGGARGARRRPAPAATKADRAGQSEPPGRAPAERPGDPGGVAPDRAGNPDQGVEISGPDLEMSGSRGPAPEPGRPRRGSAALDTTLDDSDPFVDDAALISWMGFNARTGIGRPGSIAVADEILDPPRREAAATPARTESNDTPVESMEIPVGPAEIPAGTMLIPATPAEDRTEPAARRAAQKPPLFTVPGSFWSFGRRRVPAADPGKDPLDER
jgi:hypothetical protein